MMHKAMILYGIGLILMLIATVADARGLVLTAPLEQVRATTVYAD